MAATAPTANDSGRPSSGPAPGTFWHRSTIRQQAVVEQASHYKAGVWILALFLFPFQLIGWTAALLWVMVTYIVAAVQVSFMELHGRFRRDG